MSVDTIINTVIGSFVKQGVHPLEGSGHVFKRGADTIISATGKDAKGKTKALEFKLPATADTEKAVKALLDLFKDHQKYNAKAMALGGKAYPGAFMGWAPNDTLPPELRPKGKGLLGYLGW